VDNSAGGNSIAGNVFFNDVNTILNADQCSTSSQGGSLPSLRLL
jgi:hypothetical protein